MSSTNYKRKRKRSVRKKNIVRYKQSRKTQISKHVKTFKRKTISKRRSKKGNRGMYKRYRNYSGGGLGKMKDMKCHCGAILYGKNILNNACTCVYQHDDPKINYIIAKRLHSERRLLPFNKAANESFAPGLKVQHRGGPASIDKWFAKYREERRVNALFFFARGFSYYKYSHNTPYYILIKKQIHKGISKWYIVYGHHDLYEIIRHMKIEELEKHIIEVDGVKKFQITVNTRKYEIQNSQKDRNQHVIKGLETESHFFYKRRPGIKSVMIGHDVRLNLDMILIPESELELFNNHIISFNEADFEKIVSDKTTFQNFWYLTAHGKNLDSPDHISDLNYTHSRNFSYRRQEYVELKEDQIIIMLCDPNKLDYPVKADEDIFTLDNAIETLENMKVNKFSRELPKNWPLKYYIKYWKNVKWYMMKKSKASRYCVFRNSAPNIYFDFMHSKPYIDQLIENGYKTHNRHLGLFKVPIELDENDKYNVISQKYFDNYNATEEWNKAYKIPEMDEINKLPRHGRRFSGEKPNIDDMLHNISNCITLKELLRKPLFENKKFIMIITACREGYFDYYLNSPNTRNIPDHEQKIKIPSYSKRHDMENNKPLYVPRL